MLRPPSSGRILLGGHPPHGSRNPIRQPRASPGAYLLAGGSPCLAPRPHCSCLAPPWPLRFSLPLPTPLLNPSQILCRAHETLNKPFQFGLRESYCQTFAGGFSELLHQRTHTCQSRRRVSTVSTEVSNQEPQNVQLSNPAKSSGEASDAPLKLALSVDLGWKERYYLPQSPGGNTRLVHGLWPVVDQTDIGSKCFNAFRKDFVQAAPCHHSADCNKEVTRLRSGGSPLSSTR